MEFKVGDIVEGEIIDFTHEGNGILRVDNIAIFATGGLIGDQVQVEIKEIKKNYCTGSVIKLIQPSKDRVELDFDIKESKGGIPFIDYDYKKQLEWKTNKVKTDLEKIGGLPNAIVHDIIGMDNPYRYRNHTQVPVGTRDGKSIIGFYEINSNEIVDMEESILHPELGNKIISLIRQWIEEHGIPAYNKKTKTGILKHIGIRINKDNEAMVILVTRGNELHNQLELVRLFSDNLDEVISLYHNVNKMDYGGTYGKRYKKIFGKDKIIDYIGDYKFSISPNSFFQTNRDQAFVLYEKAKEYLSLNSKDIILDLYCGIGTISIYVANDVKRVYGVEVAEESIKDARTNARLNKISNIEFITGKAEETLPFLIDRGVEANKIIVDPPRKGCDKKVLDAIINISPETIVYVSCNPTTLARDLKILVENGYKVKEVQPVDMFPHTAHVESIILMTSCTSEAKK